MNPDKRVKRKFIEIVILAIGFALQMVVYFAGSILGAVYSVSVGEAVIISLIIFAMALICLMVSRFSVELLVKSRVLGHKNGLKMVIDKKSYRECTENVSMLCPLNIGLKEHGVTVKITEETSKQDRLYDKETVYEVEKNGYNMEPWNNIWIFSDDLSSEIDSGNNKAEPVLVANITTNKTKYTIFHLNNPNHRTAIKEREYNIINSLGDEESKALISFVSINVNDGYIGKNTLPLLCGSILFSQGAPDEEGNLHFAKGYLSIRKNTQDIPIYYSMPRCMLDEYSVYFANLLKINGGTQ